MGVLVLHPDAEFEPMTIGGALIVAALTRTAWEMPFDIVLMHGTDGRHSGSLDPHPLGKAVDVRSHSFSGEEKDLVLKTVTGHLSDFTKQLGADGTVVPTSGGFATQLFFGFLEDPRTSNEHFHWQVRKGRSVPLAQEVRA